MSYPEGLLLGLGDSCLKSLCQRHHRSVNRLTSLRTLGRREGEEVSLSPSGGVFNEPTVVPDGNSGGHASSNRVLVHILNRLDASLLKVVCKILGEEPVVEDVGLRIEDIVTPVKHIAQQVAVHIRQLSDFADDLFGRGLCKLADACGNDLNRIGNVRVERNLTDVQMALRVDVASTHTATAKHRRFSHIRRVVKPTAFRVVLSASEPRRGSINGPTNVVINPVKDISTTKSLRLVVELLQVIDSKDFSVLVSVKRVVKDSPFREGHRISFVVSAGSGRRVIVLRTDKAVFVVVVEAFTVQRANRADSSDVKVRHHRRDADLLAVSSTL